MKGKYFKIVLAIAVILAAIVIAIFSFINREETSDNLQEEKLITIGFFAGRSRI